MIALYVFLGSLAAGLAALAATYKPLHSARLMRKNFRGVEIPTSAGIVFAPAFLAVWLPVTDYAARRFTLEGELLTSQFRALWHGFNAVLVLVLGFVLLGLFDDAAGDGASKGFKGHFSSAMTGGFTSGTVKAVLGFLVALAALYPFLSAWALFDAKDYGILVLNAAVVALAANFFNLLDLRPGRAMKVFFPALGLCVGLTLRYEGIPLLPYGPLYLYVTPALSIAAVALMLFPGDLRERFMIGDAGSNVLGAVVGLGLVLGTGFWWRLGVLILLLALNMASEIWSFSDIISSNRVLNWIDSLGRKGTQTERG